MDKQEVECDCISDPVHICEAIDPDGIYVCTRRKGHKGDHRACSGDNHAMKTWPHLIRVLKNPCATAKKWAKAHLSECDAPY